MSTPLVFKFGGASVKDAASVRNVAAIIARYAERPMVVVVSAMGKMTNAFESIVGAWSNGDVSAAKAGIAGIEHFHKTIIDELFPSPPEDLIRDVTEFVQHLESALLEKDRSYSEQYDFIVHHGELLSTKIIASYVAGETPTVWQDTRELVKTDGQFRRATVQWDLTQAAISAKIDREKVNVVQGFIGSDAQGRPTTLGREGSDYTGAVFAYCLGADSLTIWKDVPGMLNGDPKTFKDTTKIDVLPFGEAIELAFYGASIIHPKTIQPLQKKSIPLHIKSFVDPEATGTTISDVPRPVPEVANFILKKQQALLQLSTKDLAFIAEHHLSAVYHLFATQGVVVNLMRNTATKALFCVNHDPIIIPRILKELAETFDVQLTENTALLTVRHYSASDEAAHTAGKSILLEQRTPDTVQWVYETTAQQ